MGEHTDRHHHDKSDTSSHHNRHHHRHRRRGNKRDRSPDRTLMRHERDRERDARLSAYELQERLMGKQFNDIGQNDNTTTGQSVPFVWRKKVENEILSNKFNESSYSITSYNIRLANKSDEIEHVRRKRDERIAELADSKALREQMARDALADENNNWQQNERMFATRQHIMTAILRINENRQTPIDMLAKNLYSFDEVRNEYNKDQRKHIIQPIALDVDITTPFDIVNNLDADGMTTLTHDITAYLDSCDTGLEQLYWQCCLVLINHRMAELHVRHENEQQQAMPVPPVVSDDIRAMFHGKSYEQLRTMESFIEQKLSNDDGTVDVTFWSNVLHHMQLFKANAFLTEHHINVITHRHGEPASQLLRTKQYYVAADMQDKSSNKHVVVSDGVSDSISHDLQLIAASTSHDSSVSGSVARFASAAEEKLFTGVEASGLAKDENKFSVEVKLSSVQSTGLNKYDLRKPRSFNKVRTGYDWNKYNQTHYSKDNPPPKIVQGYKFMIFYPDLIDKTIAPHYTLTDDTDMHGADFQIIRFIAGAPYEDVAFRIVKKEWEMNHKRGYKCVFDRGVLQLNFNFKRYFYKR